MRRVVVTGLGAVTPIGLNTDDFWDAIKKNTVGIDTITSFDSSGYKAHLAAEGFKENGKVQPVCSSSCI